MSASMRISGSFMKAYSADIACSPSVQVLEFCACGCDLRFPQRDTPKL